MVHPQDQDDPRIKKDLASWAALEAAFKQARGEAENGQAFLENDLRAHAHPTRMEVIRLAAADLAAKLNSLCPACGTPGFWVVDRVDTVPSKRYYFTWSAGGQARYFYQKRERA